jgi:ubiquinone/menaquinone biosynthesis C-methylase UbiE
MNKTTTRTAALPGHVVPWAKSQPVWSGPVPDYVLEHYWWAYVHPRGVKFFDREWMVNLILFGNMARLRDGALDEIGPRIPGRTLQVACVYGDFTPKLVERLAPGASLDVVDVTPIQLTNTRRKIDPAAPVTFHHRDSTALAFDDAAFDQVVVFFLLHEQPDEVKARTLAEAARVLKPGGKLILADYHRPHWWSPMRWLFRPILGRLEPFAPVLWDREIASWLPRSRGVLSLSKKTVFGGQYQTVALTIG